MDDKIPSVVEIIGAFRLHLGKIGYISQSEVTLPTDRSDSSKNKVIDFILKISDFVRLCDDAKLLETSLLGTLLQEVASPLLSSSVVASFFGCIYQSTDYWPYFSAGFLKVFHVLSYTSTPNAYLISQTVNFLVLLYPLQISGHVRVVGHCSVGYTDILHPDVTVKCIYIVSKPVTVLDFLVTLWMKFFSCL
ncbi:unnamed protein product [Heterobilharzia americana]|nr:unnamed protein product [Heterobilharzia americana]